MSIAEKLSLIAENIPKVYEAGKQAGGGGNDIYFEEIADVVNNSNVGGTHIFPDTPYSEYDEKIKECIDVNYITGRLVAVDEYNAANVHPHLYRLRERMRDTEEFPPEFVDLSVENHVDVVISDFDKIDEALKAQGIETPVTDTSSYGEIIAELGRKADMFWDSYQENGTRVDYERSFAGAGWNDKTFKPKYSMQPTNANAMFSNSKITNLKKLLDDAGVVLDFSKVSYGRMVQTFMSSAITDVGVIDLTSCGASVTYLLYSASKLVNIDKIILPSDGAMTINNTNFNGATALKEVRFEGVIGQNGFDIHWSKSLSADSLLSIISCLSSTTTGLTITLPSTAEVNYNAVYGDIYPWEVLIATKSNWTIAYL